MAGAGNRTRGKDEVGFRQAVDDHIKNSNRFHYRNTLEGALNVKQLQKSQDFIIAVRKKMKNINQSTAEKVFKNKAKDEEDTWHLAKETKEYAKEQALMTRAMLRDVEQNVAKARKQPNKKAPSWALPFLAADRPEAEGDAEENDEDDDEEEAEAHAEVTRKPAAAEEDDDDILDSAAIFERELVRAARAWAARRKNILIKGKKRAREVERAMRRAAHKQMRGARLRRWLRLHKQQRRAGNSS